MSVNKVILIGNLGRDPEVRTTGSGTAVCSIRLATTERRKVGGEWTDHTEWHSITTFGKTAENVGRFCRKGKQVYVEGRLQTRKWQDKDGADRWTTEVVADVVRFLGGKSDGGGSGGSTGGGYSNSGGQTSGYGSDEEIPF